MRLVLEPEQQSSDLRRRRSNSSPATTTLQENRNSLPDLQHHAGNQAIQSLFRSGLLQPKLTIGVIDDPAEREADAIATRIIGAPATSKAPDRSNREQHLLHHSPFGQDVSSSASGIVEQVLHSVGRPLDPATRAFFDPRLGQDLSHIRVHTDQAASDSAQSIHALAYTAGRDIAFAPGRYSPHTDEGKRLLAHELAHTVQQRSGGSSVVRRAPDLGGLTVNATHTGTNVPISGVKIHIDQKLVSGRYSTDLVTDSNGNTRSIELPEGDYTITADYQCCEQVQDAHVTAGVDGVAFLTFALCRCGIASTDQGGDGAGAAAGSTATATS